eukprot:1190774-Prorocentrum_minimum.AAC.1
MNNRRMYNCTFAETFALGSKISKFAKLCNISPDIGRFFIRPPAPPLSLKYKQGALSAGMAVRLEVTFSAEQPGDYCEEVIINTEHHHFVLTVSAKVCGEDGDFSPLRRAGGAGGNSLLHADSPAPTQPGEEDGEDGPHEGGGAADIGHFELDENATLQELIGGEPKGAEEDDEE